MYSEGSRKSPESLRFVISQQAHALPSHMAATVFFLIHAPVEQGFRERGLRAGVFTFRAAPPGPHGEKLRRLHRPMRHGALIEKPAKCVRFAAVLGGGPGDFVGVPEAAIVAP